ncbi:MAG: Crp/Fnr family transcriptional regulator [Chloroflexota bacterium]
MTALSTVAFFRQLTDTQLEVLTKQLAKRRYLRGETIFSQGDRGDGLYIITDGHVGISRQGPDGNELILTVCEAGEYFGELALVDDEPRSASAVAMENSVTQFLSRVAFRTFLQDHPSAVFACLEVVTRQLRRCTDLADEIALLDIRSRLARRLLHLAERGVVSGGDGPTSHPERETRITQQQLADMLGASRESVNKHLNALVDERAIRLEHGHVHIVDRQALEDCAQGG